MRQQFLAGILSSESLWHIFLIIAANFIEQRDRGGGGGRGAARRADCGWGHGAERRGRQSGRAARLGFGLRLHLGSSSRTKPLPLSAQRLPLYAAHVAAPPRARPASARHGAHARGPRRAFPPPPRAAARSRSRGSGRKRSRVCLRLWARGPCASPLRGAPRPQGRRGRSPGCASDLGQGTPPPPPPQHSHAHTLTFFGTQFPQRITTLGSVMACACLVPGTASGLCAPSHQLCELAQRKPLRVPGGFCSRAAVPARGGRRALRPPECSRGPAARTGSRERHAQGWSQRSQSVPTPRSTAGSAPFSQPEIRWILAGVFSQRLSRHLPVGDWKDQRLALPKSV